MQLTRQQALLAAMFPVVALSALNHFYKLPLYRLHPAWYWAADGLQFVVMPVLACWFLLRPAGIGPMHLGLGRGAAPGDTVFTALLLLAATWPAYTIAHAYLGAYSDLEVALTHAAIPSAGAASWLVAVYMSATAALVEEVVFRALPWLYVQAAVRRYQRPAYILATSGVFALIHSEQGPGGMLSAFWFALVAAGLYLKQRSLWPLVLGHFLFDLAVFGPW